MTQEEFEALAIVAAAVITVVSVVQSGSSLTWTFSSAVTLTGANVPELENDFDKTGSWQSPDICTQGSANSIVASYSGMPMEVTPWRIACAVERVAVGADRRPAERHDRMRRLAVSFHAEQGFTDSCRSARSGIGTINTA